MSKAKEKRNWILVTGLIAAFFIFSFHDLLRLTNPWLLLVQFFVPLLLIVGVIALSKLQFKISGGKFVLVTFAAYLIWLATMYGVLGLWYLGVENFESFPGYNDMINFILGAVLFPWWMLLFKFKEK